MLTLMCSFFPGLLKLTERGNRKIICVVFSSTSIFLLQLEDQDTDLAKEATLVEMFMSWKCTLVGLQPCLEIISTVTV